MVRTLVDEMMSKENNEEQPKEKVAAAAPPAAAEPEAEEKPLDAKYVKPKIGFLTKLLHRGGSSSNPHVNDGQIFLKNNQPDQAAKAFQAAVNEDPDCVDAYIGLGKSLSEIGGVQNAKRAVQNYYKALEYDFLRIEIYEAVVMLYLKLGDNKNAHAEKKKLQTVRTLKSNPNNVVANNNLGVIQLHQKQYDGALKSFETASRYAGAHSVAQLNLAKTWLQKGIQEKEEEFKKKMLVKAAGELERYLNNNNQADGVLVKAKIFMAWGDYKKAAALCNEAIALDGTLKEAFNTKRAIEEKLGNIGEASDAFNKYQEIARNEPHPK